jgi:L-alanine-DL-glutamate epimerase-like enolase superfamily enzyme
MAVPHCSTYEVLVPHAAGSYDLDYVTHGLAEPIEITASGDVVAPTRPGLGIDLDWPLLRSNVIAELS